MERGIQYEQIIKFHFFHIYILKFNEIVNDALFKIDSIFFKNNVEYLALVDLMLYFW